MPERSTPRPENAVSVALSGRGVDHLCSIELFSQLSRAVARSACARGGRPAESSPSSEAGSVAEDARENP